MNVNVRKVAIIGCGFVGSTCAYTLMQHGLFSEMVLLDADRAREWIKTGAQPTDTVRALLKKVDVL